MSDSRKYTSVSPHDVQRSREQYSSENGSNQTTVASKTKAPFNFHHYDQAQATASNPLDPH
eukprot:1143252-Pelagomonas_calceolata.AAC.1